MVPPDRNTTPALPADLDALADGTPLRPYLARLLDGSVRHRKFVIASANDLFSSANIDVGTRRLLRLLSQPDSPLVQTAEAAEAASTPVRILDVGCGTGAIGVGLARGFGPGVEVTMIDRDHLAVAVARMNLRANALDNARVLDAQFGFGALEREDNVFDWIISNVPAKVGDAGLRELLLGAGARLARGGHVAFVHVNPLMSHIDALQADYERAHGASHPLVVIATEVGTEHTIRHWQFPNGQPPTGATDPLAPWRRSDVPDTFEADAHRPRVPHVAVHDLPEFDTLDRRTRLVVQVTKFGLPRTKDAPAERLLVINPRHGALPLLLADTRKITAIGLASRDTLELAVADRNLRPALAAWGLDVEVATVSRREDEPWLAAPDGAWDLIAGCPRWREGRVALAHQLAMLRESLTPGGAFALGVESGDLQAVRDAAREAGLRVGRELKRKGQAGVILRPKA